MKRKILIVSPSLVTPGGVERVVSALSALLVDRYTVFECSFDPPSSRRHFDSPAKFLPLGASLQLPLLLRPISYLIDALRLRRTKHALGIDITISNLWRADLLNVLSGGNDQKISICHINIKGNPSNRLMLRLLPLVARVYRHFDRLVTVSRPLADELRQLYGIEDGRLSVIYNPVSWRIPQQMKRDNGRVRAVWCGRMVTEKNIVVLADIFAVARKACPSLQLILVGDGPIRDELEARMAHFDLRIGHVLDDTECDVIMTGFVNDPNTLVAQCDFQLAPSLAEGLPMAVIEGFSLGLPAIAADCHGGGLHDALSATGHYQPGRVSAEETTCGFLLPIPDLSKPDTNEIWATHLVSLARDTALREQLAIGARARAEDFSPAAIGPKWDALFDSLAEA